MGIPSPLRVVIAEATAEDAYDVLRELRRAGHDPFAQVVATPDEMTRVLQAGPWHVAIGDAELPSLGPAAAVELIRAHGLDVPLIALARGAGEERAVEAMRAGAREYLRRDRLEALGAAVEREVGAAAERRLRRQRLLSAERSPSIAALASAVSHEINNPLASVMANLAYVREELAPFRGGPDGLPEATWRDLDEALQDTVDSAGRIRDLVRGLAAFSSGDD